MDRKCMAKLGMSHQVIYVRRNLIHFYDEIHSRDFDIFKMNSQPLKLKQLSYILELEFLYFDYYNPLYIM